MNKPIVTKQLLTHPPELVWNAITQAAQMRKWFFSEIEDFSPELGFSTEFNVHAEGKDFLHRWKIIEVSPQLSILYDWRYGGYPGESTVNWQLSPQENGTLLTVTHRGIDSFPQSEPAFTEESCRGGWQYFINQRLKDYMQTI